MLSLQVSRAMESIAAGPARTTFESFFGALGAPPPNPPNLVNLACNPEIVVNPLPQESAQESHLVTFGGMVVGLARIGVFERDVPLATLCCWERCVCVRA